MPNPMLWTLEEIAQATGGTLCGDIGDVSGASGITGIVIDSREAQRGDLFIPLIDKRDGHDFIGAAFENGAAATLSEIDLGSQIHIRVKDSFKAMEDMARSARLRSNALCVGVTGSVGKTSIKEMIAAIFKQAGPSHKSVRSFNNHWGVPLTMARMPRGTKHSVFEMGMNHAGELSQLSALLRPNIAVISLIAPAHLAHFNTVDDIAAAKAEIFEGLAAGGVAILNRDDPYFDRLSKAALVKQAKIISFGQNPQADIRLSRLDIGRAASRAKLSYAGKSYDLTLPAVGVHWLQNAAAALAVAISADISMKSAISALVDYEIPQGRGAAFKANISGHKVYIIDESYNANPVSIRAAINSAAHQAEGRLIAVLGDMFELGKDEIEIHASLAPDIEAANVARVIFTGECMRALRGALERSRRGQWVHDAAQAFEALQDEIESGDTVLIKGSNAAGLGDLIRIIKSEQDKDGA